MDIYDLATGEDVPYDPELYEACCKAASNMLAARADLERDRIKDRQLEYEG